MMNHWDEIRGKQKIILIGEAVDPDDRIVSIKKEEDGNFRIREECDRYFSQTMSKDEIIEMLQEAIDWVKEQ